MLSLLSFLIMIFGHGNRKVPKIRTFHDVDKAEGSRRESGIKALDAEDSKGTKKRQNCTEPLPVAVNIPQNIEGPKVTSPDSQF